MAKQTSRTYRKTSLARIRLEDRLLYVATKTAENALAACEKTALEIRVRTIVLLFSEEQLNAIVGEQNF